MRPDWGTPPDIGGIPLGLVAAMLYLQMSC